MNRFKFRVWDKHLKRMDYFDLGSAIFHTPSDCDEPMQFTGLKDKNGKEIWEGDVVKVGDRFYYIEYGLLSGCFTASGFSINRGEIRVETVYMEVVGNKYEGMKP